MEIWGSSSLKKWIFSKKKIITCYELFYSQLEKNAHIDVKQKIIFCTENHQMMFCTKLEENMPKSRKATNARFVLYKSGGKRTSWTKIAQNIRCYVLCAPTCVFQHMFSGQRSISLTVRAILGEIQIQIQNQKCKNHQHLPDISIHIEMKEEKISVSTPCWQYWVNLSEAKKIRKTKTFKYMKYSSICTQNSNSKIADNIELGIMLNCTQFMIEVGICALKNVPLFAFSSHAVFFCPCVICTSNWCQTQSTIFEKY